MYTLNWLPIGGFVKLEGEDGDNANDPRAFSRARLPVKLGILVAGVAMNLLLAFVIFTGLALWGEPQIGVRIGEVVAGAPAAASGLVAGDTIVTINGTRYSAFGNPQQAIDDLQANGGQPVTLGIIHADGTLERRRRRRCGRQRWSSRGRSGSGRRPCRPSARSTTRSSRRSRPAPKRTVQAFSLILVGLGDLARSIVNDPTAAPPAYGPVGIAVELGNVLWGLGPLYVIYLTALLSANLALVNILPFPPLDGGRMLVIVLKAIPRYGRRISLRAEQLTYAVGFVALFTFLIWITVFDIARQVSGTP